MYFQQQNVKETFINSCDALSQSAVCRARVVGFNLQGLLPIYSTASCTSVCKLSWSDATRTPRVTLPCATLPNVCCARSWLGEKYPHSEFLGLQLKAESYITPKGPLKCKRCRRVATLSVVNPKQTGLRLNPDLHGERPAIKCVSHSAVLLSLRQGWVNIPTATRCVVFWPKCVCVCVCLCVCIYIDIYTGFAKKMYTHFNRWYLCIVFEVELNCHYNM
jgi:hypothetical protein